jgi:hypothetical protein
MTHALGLARTTGRTSGVAASVAVAWPQQPDSPDSTYIPMRYTVYEIMLLMMDW